MSFKNSSKCKTMHIWLGGVAKKDRFDELSKIGANQFAANNMQLLYIDGIEKNINDKMIVISSHFIPYYSKNKISFFHGSRIDDWIEISFINIPIFKQISKSINIAKEVKKIIKNNRDCNFVFYIYSMTTPLMRAAKTINYFRKKYKLNIKVIQIVPDLPEYMNFSKRNLLWKIAKKFDIKYLYHLKKYIDKFVLFSPYMAEKLSISDNSFIVIEGMVDPSITNYLNNASKNEKVLMYAGSIHKDYGIYDLIEAFGTASIKGFKLHLYGNCPNIEELNKAINKYNNIKYFGSISREKILDLESKALLLVNPRKPFKDFTKYSFPSKTMEYLLSGTPVLMYKLKSIPKEYDDYIFYIDEKSDNGLKDALQNICNMDTKILKEKGNQAVRFVVDNKSNVVQCKRILEFIE